MRSHSVNLTTERKGGAGVAVKYRRKCTGLRSTRPVQQRVLYTLMNHAKHGIEVLK
jgi:hypothetical protein